MSATVGGGHSPVSEECCPLSGTPFDPSSHPMSAAAVFAGLGARADRRELEASVSGPSSAELPRVEALADALLTELDQLDDPSARVRLLASSVQVARSDGGVLDERDCLLLGLLVTETGLRDLAWALISPANAEDHVRLWSGVVARVPPRLAAAPLCLLGMAAWLSGCRRLAELLLRAAGTGGSRSTRWGDCSPRSATGALPPSLWRQIGGDMQAELRC